MNKTPLMHKLDYFAVITCWHNICSPSLPRLPFHQQNNSKDYTSLLKKRYHTCENTQKKAVRESHTLWDVCNDTLSVMITLSFLQLITYALLVYHPRSNKTCHGLHARKLNLPLRAKSSSGPDVSRGVKMGRWNDQKTVCAQLSWQLLDKLS